MAKQGNNAAYIQSRGLGDGVTEDIRYWNQDSARRREEERLKDNEAYDRAEKKRREDREFYEKNIKPLNNWESGSKSLNELQARTLQQVADERYKVLENLKNVPEGSEEYIRLATKLSGLNSAVDKIKPFSSAISALYKEVEKNVQGGKIKDNEKVSKFRGVFQNGFENIQTGLDENGDIVLAYRDSNGDGENDIIGTESFSNIMNGVTSWKFDPNFDIDALAKEKAAALGKNIDVTDRNYKKTTVEGPLDTSINTMAENVMLSPDGSLSDEGKSFAQDLGLDPNSEDAINEVVNSFKEKMAPYISKTKKEEVDNSARISAGRLALDQQKEGNKTARITEPVAPTAEIWGDNFKNIDTNRVNSVGVSGVALSAIRDGKEILSNAELQNATYNKDGKMVIDVVVPKYKSMTEQDYSALESRAASGDADAERELRSAKRDGKGGARVVIPGQNERKSVVIPKEDEAKVANEMGETIESLKAKIYKDDTKKSAGTTYKGLDANGDPIFE